MASLTSVPRVLVLGSQMTATPVADGLVRLGFEVFKQADSKIVLPSPADSDALDRLREVLGGYQVEFLHPGTSMWADRPELPTLCQELGITAISPPARVLSLYGNRLSLLEEAEKIGIDHLALDFDPLVTLREIRVWMSGRAKEIRFPFILKSVIGDAGVTIFVVHEEEDLETRLPLWLDQLRRNVGQVILFPERYIESSHLIMVPFARLNGKIEIFPKVDASLQSGFKKYVEFCPASDFPQAVEARMEDWTKRIAEATGFIGVGFLEFMVDGRNVYFLGGGARLNTEYELWERVAGTHAISWQLAALQTGLASESLVVNNPNPNPHPVGLVARIFSEDPMLGLPHPGVIYEKSPNLHELENPMGVELRIAPSKGDRVAKSNDTLEHGFLGSIWVGGASRIEVIQKAIDVLDHTWISGSLQTNERFLHELLAHPFVQQGHFHTGFVDEEFLPPLKPEAWLQPVFAWVCAQAKEVQDLKSGLSAERWMVGNSSVKVPGSFEAGPRWVTTPSSFKIPLDKDASGVGISGELVFEDKAWRVCAYPTTPSRWVVRVGYWFQTVRWLPPAAKLDPSQKQARKLSALVSGRVHSLLFREGATIPSHTNLVTLESLRKLVPHALPVEVKLIKWLVQAEDQVESGQDLAEIEV